MRPLEPGIGEIDVLHRVPFYCFTGLQLHSCMELTGCVGVHCLLDWILCSEHGV